MAHSPELEKTLAAFLQSKSIDRAASKKTLEAYRSDLGQLFEFLGEASERNLASIAPADLERFVNEKISNLKPASRSRKISAIRQFFRFCVQEEILSENPSEFLETPKRDARLPQFLNETDLAKLLATLERGIPYEHEAQAPHLQKRDRALVLLLYATGVRVTELISLHAQDIDLELSLIRVRGKGSKERLVPFADLAREELVEYQKNARDHLVPPGSDSKRLPFFLNHRGEGLTRQGFWQLLKRLAFEAGLPDTLSPHLLRHTFATHLLEKGMNLRTLQLLLGHADLSTTQIYAEVSREHLKTSLLTFHPRGTVPHKD